MRALILSLICLSFYVAASEPPTVLTSSGRVVGESIEGGALRFLGIPYAASTAAANRWRPPRPVTPWHGIRSAVEYGDICPQILSDSFGPWTREFLAHGDMSEDCLSVNVWTPTLKRNEKLPVFVWIHGGAFVSGSGSVPIYAGYALAKQDVVVVTFNYRLGIFGFLGHPELDGEGVHSGEFGLLDQIAALRWVQANIAAFGGDPQRVTVAGQSAGAASVRALLSTPLTDGLFSKAIMQSSAAMGIALPTSAQSAALGLAVQAQLLADNLESLRQVPATELLQLAASAELSSATPGVRFSPTLGRTFSDAFEKAPIPILTGITGNENSVIMGQWDITSKDEFAALAGKNFGDQSGAFMDLYLRDNSSIAAAARQMLRDKGLAAIWFWLQTLPADVPVFTYLFEQAPPGEPEGHGSFHSGELPYVFGTLREGGRPYTRQDRDLSALMVRYWVNFIRSGNPNGEDLEAWPELHQYQLLRFGGSRPAQAIPVMDKSRLNLYRDAVAQGSKLGIFTTR